MELVINPALTYTFLNSKLLLITGGCRIIIIDDATVVDFITPLLRQTGAIDDTIKYSERKNIKSSIVASLLDKGVLIEHFNFEGRALNKDRIDYYRRLNSAFELRVFERQFDTPFKMVCRNVPDLLLSELQKKYENISSSNDDSNSLSICLESRVNPTYKTELNIYERSGVLGIEEIPVLAEPRGSSVSITCRNDNIVIACLVIHHIECNFCMTKAEAVCKDTLRKNVVRNFDNLLINEAHCHSGLSAILRVVIRYGFGYLNSPYRKRIAPSAGNLSSNSCFVLQYDPAKRHANLFLYRSGNNKFHKISTVTESDFLKCSGNLTHTVVIAVANIAELEKRYVKNATSLANYDAGVSAFCCTVRAFSLDMNVTFSFNNGLDLPCSLLGLSSSKEHIFITSSFVLEARNSNKSNPYALLYSMLKRRNSIRNLSYSESLLSSSIELESILKLQYKSLTKFFSSSVSVYKAIKVNSKLCQLNKLSFDNSITETPKQVDVDFIYNSIAQQDIRHTGLVYLFVPNTSLEITNKEGQVMCGFASMLFWTVSISLKLKGTLYGTFPLNELRDLEMLSGESRDCLALCIG